VTAGDVIFQGAGTSFLALDARSGRERELSDVESDTQLLVLLPDQKVMMAFDTIYSATDHVPTLAGHFEHWLAVLEDLKTIGDYDEIVIGHYAPTDRSAIDTTAAYLHKAKQIHANSKDAASYADNLKAAFPNRAMPEFVDLSASLLYVARRRQRHDRRKNGRDSLGADDPSRRQIPRAKVHGCGSNALTNALLSLLERMPAARETSSDVKVVQKDKVARGFRWYRSCGSPPSGSL
jgi:hypothetical protein